MQRPTEPFEDSYNEDDCNEDDRYEDRNDNGDTRQYRQRDHALDEVSTT
jgi:hypothetical protein